MIKQGILFCVLLSFANASYAQRYVQRDLDFNGYESNNLYEQVSRGKEGLKAYETFAVADVNGNKLRYSILSANVARLDGCEKYSNGILVVPAQVTHKGRTYQVEEIRPGAFCYGCTDYYEKKVYDDSDKLIEITIPSTINNFPTSVTRSTTGRMSLGYSGVFWKCKNLRRVHLPSNFQELGAYAFELCESLTEIDLPSSVSLIGPQCFAYCTNLKEIRIPEGVRSLLTYKVLYGGVFEGCSRLKKVYLPSTMQLLGERCFAKCTSLTEVVGLHDGIELKGSISMKEDPFADSGFNLASYKMPSRPKVEQSPEPQKDVIAKSVSIDNSIDQNIPSGTSIQKNTFAIIIGNEKYQQVAEVPFANNDARTFAEYCRKTLGLPDKNVKLYENATYGTMIGAMSDIQKIAKVFKGEISVLFYYAGHGIPDEATGDGYLLPVDADGMKTEVCYSLSRLYKELGELGARSVAAFVDACFSGAGRDDGMVVAARGVAIKARIGRPTGNTVVFTAATDKQTAYPYEEKGHGMFTYYLLKKLRETKGDCTLGELGSYISDEVAKQAVVTNGKEQTPVVLTSEGIVSGWRELKLK